MSDMQPTQGSGLAAKVIGFMALVLGFTMMIAGASAAQLGMPQRVALGCLGLFGCYWGLRFLRLGRQQSRGD